MRDVHWWSQTWEVRPSPSKSTELKPPLGGYLNPKLEVSHRKDTWFCQPSERHNILSKACFLQDPGVKQMGKKVVEVSFYQCLMFFLPKKVEEKGKMLRKTLSLLRKISIPH